MQQKIAGPQARWRDSHGFLPRVGASRQPWAGGCNPVGIGRSHTKRCGVRGDDSSQLPFCNFLGETLQGLIVWQLFKEFLSFLKQEKKWWLLPLVLLLLALGALILFSSTSVLAPFLYPFM
ncbi:MAG: hypothetical protein EXS30_01010 [Pedosphaera sp.]|nr:hypothetical protein [Pedosphaera sp.]